MPIMKELNNRIMIKMLIITSIMEKFVWRIAGLRFSLFYIFGIILIMVSLLSGIPTLKFPGMVKNLMGNKLLQIIYVFAQFLIIYKTSDVLNQYVKGIFELALNFAILCFAFQMIYKDKKQWTSLEFRDMIITAGIINVIYNLIQFFYKNIDAVLVSFFKSDVSRFGVDAYGDIGRLTGLFTDSNNNGAFLVLTFILLIYKVHGSKHSKVENYKGRWLLFVVEILTGIVLVLSFSRTAWIGFALFMLYYFWNNGTKAQFRILLLGIIAAIAIVYFYSTNTSFSSIINSKLLTIKTGQLNLDSHFSILFEALSIWTMSTASILFGTGYNCLSVYYESIYGLPGYKAHSYYVQNLAETGIFGFIIMSAFIWILYKMSKYIAIEETKQCIQGVLLSTLIMNITYDSMVQPYFVVVMLFVLVAYVESALVESIINTILEKNSGVI